LVAKSLGRHLFEAFDSLTSDPTSGVRWCCLGNLDERQEALQAWRTSQAVVLDLTALYTIRRLNLFHLFRGCSSLPFIPSHATFDQLKDIVTMESMHGRQGYTTTDDHGRYIFGEVSEEARRVYIESLQGLVQFVREHCSILPTPELADLDAERREQLQGMFDR